MRDPDELIDVVRDERVDGFVVAPSDRNEQFWNASLLVPLAVAVLEETDPEQLSPLYDSVDPDALDALVNATDEEAGLCIRFEYESYDVRIQPGLTIGLRPRK